MPVSVQGDCAPITVDVTQATGVQPLSMLCMQSHGHMLSAFAILHLGSYTHEDNCM